MFLVCAAELEFVQIIIIIVVMTVMVVVIICLLNHYKLSTWSFITRQSQARRHDHALQQVSNCVRVCVCVKQLVRFLHPNRSANTRGIFGVTPTQAEVPAMLIIGPFVALFTCL